MNLEEKGIRLLPVPLTFTMPATPGLSLFELELSTGKIRFVTTANYSPGEIANSIKKNYEFTTDNSYLYIEALNLKQARKKFTKFFQDRKAKLKINEKAKTQSSEVVPQ